MDYFCMMEDADTHDFIGGIHLVPGPVFFGNFVCEHPHSVTSFKDAKAVISCFKEESLIFKFNGYHSLQRTRMNQFLCLIRACTLFFSMRSDTKSLMYPGNQSAWSPGYTRSLICLFLLFFTHPIFVIRFIYNYIQFVRTTPFDYPNEIHRHDLFINYLAISPKYQRYIDNINRWSATKLSADMYEYNSAFWNLKK